MFVFFFFSSRRRHTRFDCDWSSDVCSSDLVEGQGLGNPVLPLLARGVGGGADEEVAVHLALGRERAQARRLGHGGVLRRRSEEHTSELQSQSNLVCRLLLEKKKDSTNVSAYRETCYRG